MNGDRYHKTSHSCALRHTISPHKVSASSSTADSRTVVPSRIISLPPLRLLYDRFFLRRRFSRLQNQAAGPIDFFKIQAICQSGQIDNGPLVRLCYLTARFFRQQTDGGSSHQWFLLPIPHSYHAEIPSVYDRQTRVRSTRFHRTVAMSMSPVLRECNPC